ncbi:MAG: nucleoid occlusion factor SlmA [Gammaproteobacteria bacterium]|nr:nucleoid occlusion factor SlmA [Gammaproteobacteria bacterium]MBQ0839098.1 nucleoid occlusion factor SlmA [Gammaproteobacteria bacterium]
MTASPSSPKPSPSRRETILQALAEMLEESPHKKITTAALAKKVGVSEAALYRHFPSKARIFESLIDFIEDTLFSRISAIIKDAPNTPERCRMVITLVLSFSEKNPGLSRILTGDALTGETERLHARVNQLFARIESQLKQVLREGELRENCRTRLLASAAAELLLVIAEGKIRQFVRSNFTCLPTTHWPEQWTSLEKAIYLSAT